MGFDIYVEGFALIPADNRNGYIAIGNDAPVSAISSRRGGDRKSVV